jgi:L-arabinose isomerase
MAEKKIKSFEISTEEAVGDIISRDRKQREKKLKVGLLPVAWFEWWPMFPDSDMEQKIKQDAQKFVTDMKARFGGQYDLTAPEEVVDTLDKAFDAGEMFHDACVDIIIVNETTYLTDFIPIEAIEHLPEVPVIIYASQATENLWPTMKNTDVIRYEGLVGNAQLVGAFKKMDRRYKVVVGSLEDENSYVQIGKHLKVVDLIRRLKKVDIGLLGHTFRGMYDIEIDKTKIKGVFGPNVLYLDVTHLLGIWEKLEDKEIEAFIEQLKKDIPAPMETVTQEDMKKSVSVGLAVQKLIRRFNIDALTLLGQHHVEVSTRASADFSFYCAEKINCMTTHEGDLANLVMKYVLNFISGKLPVFLEWTAFDRNSDTLLLTHHGVVDPVIHAADMDQCRWTSSPEKWDFTGNGLSVEYCSKPGRVTLASIINEKDGWKILISSGECVELPQAPCFAPQFHFKHDKYEVTQYIQKILEEGVAHHICLVYGDYTEELKLYADYIGVKYVEI